MTKLSQSMAIHSCKRRIRRVGCNFSSFRILSNTRSGTADILIIELIFATGNYYPARQVASTLARNPIIGHLLIRLQSIHSVNLVIGFEIRLPGKTVLGTRPKIFLLNRLEKFSKEYFQLFLK